MTSQSLATLDRLNSDDLMMANQHARSGKTKKYEDLEIFHGNPSPIDDIFFYSSEFNFVNVSEDEKLIGKYLILEKLGNGAFGEVVMAEHIILRIKVAIKILEKDKFDKNHKNEESKENLKSSNHTKVLREIKLLKSIYHPNIVKLYEVMETKSHIYLVTEYLSGGELFNYLVNGRLKEKEARELVRPIGSALKYLHHHCVVHRDLKAENVLLDSKLNIKLVDFGFGNVFAKGEKLDTYCGSPPYAAPELFVGKRYNGPEVDIWAFGVLIYCLISGTFPFEAKNLQQLRERVCDGKFRVPYHMSTQLESLIRKMLNTNMNARFNIDNVLKHPWMTDNGNLPPIEVNYDLKPVEEFDQEIISVITSFGYDKDNIISSFNKNLYNEVMGIYLIMQDLKSDYSRFDVSNIDLTPQIDNFYRRSMFLTQTTQEKVDLKESEVKTERSKTVEYTDTETKKSNNSSKKKKLFRQKNITGYELPNILVDNSKLLTRANTANKASVKEPNSSMLRDRSKTEIEDKTKKSTNRFSLLFQKFQKLSFGKDSSNKKDSENLDYYEMTKFENPRYVVVPWFIKSQCRMPKKEYRKIVVDTITECGFIIIEESTYLFTVEYRRRIGYFKCILEIVKSSNQTLGINFKRLKGASLEFKNYMKLFIEKVNEKVKKS